jgi:hypothetical protein
LFDDAGRTAEVFPRLNKEGRELADVYRICNEGAHGLVELGTRVSFIRQAERLAHWLQVHK